MRTRLYTVSGAVALAVIFAAALAHASPEPVTTVQIGAVVRHAALSSDGAYLAVACLDGTVKLFETGTWDLQWEVVLDDTGSATAVAFSPDGSEIAAAKTANADVAFINAATGRVVRQLALTVPLTASDGYHEDAFLQANFMVLSSDWGLVACADEATGHVKLVNASTGDGSVVLRHGIYRGSDCLQFSPDGSLLASFGANRTVVLDAGTLEEVASPARPGIGSGGGEVAFNPDGSLLAMAGDGRSSSVSVYDLETWTLRRLSLRIEQGDAATTFSPDGGFLVVGGDRLAIWDTVDFRLIATHAILTYRRSGIEWMAFTPDQEFLLVVGTHRGYVEVWRFSDLLGN